MSPTVPPLPVPGTGLPPSVAGTGPSHPVLAAAPDPLVLLFAAITVLGGQWFLFVALSGGYWFAGSVGVDRRRAAFLLGCALCALALATTLKGIFRMPRPPGAGTAEGAAALPGLVRPLYAYAATADGFAFPSGHATAAALVWGGAALALDASRRRVRLAVGAAVVALVAASRVVIGVHYPQDVVAGVAVGGATLALLLFVGADERPGRAFTLALAVAIVGAFTEFGAEPLLVLGSTLGARITWGAVGGDALRVPATRRDGLALAVVGYPVLGGLFGAVQAVDPGPPVAFLAGAVVVGGVLALPLVLDVVREATGIGRRPPEA